jgi:hypothetical protein
MIYEVLSKLWLMTPKRAFTSNSNLLFFGIIKN